MANWLLRSAVLVWTLQRQCTMEELGLADLFELAVLAQRSGIRQRMRPEKVGLLVVELVDTGTLGSGKWKVGSIQEQPQLLGHVLDQDFVAEKLEQ